MILSFNMYEKIYFLTWKISWNNWSVLPLMVSDETIYAVIENAQSSVKQNLEFRAHNDLKI